MGSSEEDFEGGFGLAEARPIADDQRFALQLPPFLQTLQLNTPQNHESMDNGLITFAHSK